MSNIGINGSTPSTGFIDQMNDPSITRTGNTHPSPTLPPVTGENNDPKTGGPSLPTPTAAPSGKWVAVASPCCLLAQLMIEESTRQRETGRQMIQAQTDIIVGNLEKQASEIKSAAITTLALNVVSNAVTIASGATSLGMVARVDATNSNAVQMATTKAQAVGKIIEGAGGALASGASYVQSKNQADVKLLEAEAEKGRARRDQLQSLNQALTEFASKTTDFMNSMQQNMNQTRTKILG